ncbi:KH homology domain-containing protein 4-like isoform X2 [Oscarella lobularis]
MWRTGALVSLKGRYLTEEEKSMASDGGDRPLYLYVCADSEARKENALRRIKKIVLTSESNLPENLRAFTNNPNLFETIGIPPFLALDESRENEGEFFRDKVFVRTLEGGDSGINIASHLSGPQGLFLKHIVSETGAKVFLRGSGSGHIEAASGRESFEPLHIFISHSSREGLASARRLSEDLINTVFADINRRRQASNSYRPPLLAGPPPPLMSLQLSNTLPQAAVNQIPLLMPPLPPAHQQQSIGPLPPPPGPYLSYPPPPPLPPPPHFMNQPLLGPSLPPPPQFADSAVRFETPYGNPQFCDIKSEPNKEKEKEKTPTKRKFTEEAVTQTDSRAASYNKTPPTIPSSSSSSSDAKSIKFKVPQPPLRKKRSREDRVTGEKKLSVGLASLAAAYDDDSDSEDGDS